MYESFTNNEYLIYEISITIASIINVCLPCGLPPAILNGSDFLRNSNKCPVNLVSKNGLKCCCCPVKIN